MHWLVWWNGKGFGAARSIDAMDKDAVATFAYTIMLNREEVEGMIGKVWSRTREHPGASMP